VMMSSPSQTTLPVPRSLTPDICGITGTIHKGQGSNFGTRIVTLCIQFITCYDMTLTVKLWSRKLRRMCVMHSKQNRTEHESLHMG
jgi:hypothetical protein